LEAQAKPYLMMSPDLNSIQEIIEKEAGQGKIDAAIVWGRSPAIPPNACAAWTWS
jgi:hypothetical protein